MSTPSGFEKVKRVIVVLSGKGGVGKSTVTAQLAFAAAQRGLRVGVLDIDLCGPSSPKLFGLDNAEICQTDRGWLPVPVTGKGLEPESLVVMSLGFLLSNDRDSVVWRGPKKNAMIEQFLTDVHWGERDLLLIDTPPGTSDEHITILEGCKKKNIRLDGAVLVTTPQAVAVNDVRREMTFCRKTKLSVLGVIENMTGFVCPNCQECTYIFSKGGGQKLAEHFGSPFLGCIPIDPKLSLSGDRGENFIDLFRESEVASVFCDITEKIME